jgi:hypothetical protein
MPFDEEREEFRQATSDVNARLDLLTERLDDLVLSSKRWNRLIIVLIIFVGLLAAGGVGLWLAFEKIEDVRAMNCRNGNSRAEANRDEAIAGDVRVLDGFVTVLSPGLDAERLARLNQRHDSIVTEILDGALQAADLVGIDLDCNRDGWLERDDYAAHYPDGLPVDITEDAQ